MSKAEQRNARERKTPHTPLRAGGPKAAARGQGAEQGGTVPRTGRV